MSRVYPDSRLIIDGDEVVPPDRVAGLLVWVRGTKFHVYDDRVGPGVWRADGHTFELCPTT